MKTKKFLMTSLLVMGMIIAKAANGYPPELVLVSQPVLTYNANSVTIYYDVQNIGDYTYRGDLYIYLDPDNGYCYGREYMRIGAGCIRRISVSIPAYRPNPSILYTVMPYYELGDELYSFTTFEYFEPVRFCWYGYHNEPWVVIHVGPRPRYYHRPGHYRYYYDGYYPIFPPAGGHPHPMNPIHHTYGYHHHNGGYPANYHPENNVPEGYNSHSEAKVVRPSGGNTSGSMSSNGATVAPNPNNGASTRPNSGNTSNTGNTGSVSRPRSNNNSGSGRTGTTGNSGSVSRPRSNDNSGNVSRPRSNDNSGSGRTGSSGNSGNVSRPKNNSSSSGTSNSGRSSSSSSNRKSSSSSRSSNSSASSSSRTSSSSSGRR